jgi:hypothetical protein
MPANLFLHFLHRGRRNNFSDEHHDDTWLQYLPKKLDAKVISAFRGGMPLQSGTGGRFVFGWGVHILPGPNHSVLGFLLALGILVTYRLGHGCKACKYPGARVWCWVALVWDYFLCYGWGIFLFAGSMRQSFVEGVADARF